MNAKKTASGCDAGGQGGITREASGLIESRSLAQAALPLDRSNSLADLAARIRTYHQATVAALRTSVIHAMAAGELLIEAKAQVGHGHWLPWLAKNCAISERTAQLYTKLAKNRATIEKAMANPQCGVADLPSPSQW